MDSRSGIQQKFYGLEIKEIIEYIKIFGLNLITVVLEMMNLGK